jgi:hypothetical protein
MSFYAVLDSAEKSVCATNTEGFAHLLFRHCSLLTAEYLHCRTHKTHLA